jgi:hypothetical protein
MLFNIPFGTTGQELYVRERLRAIAKEQGILNSHHNITASQSAEQSVESIHARRVTAADGWHLDDLPLEQLNSIIRREHAGVGDASVFRDRELALCGQLYHCVLLGQ